MKKRLLAASLMSLFLSLSVFAAGTVTLEEALASAEENNTDLASAKVTLETTMRSNSLSSSLIPDISLEGGLSWDNMSLIDQNAGSGSGSLYFGISWDISSGILADSRVKSLNQDNAVLTYMLQAESVEEAVTLAYWNLSLSKSQAESAQMAVQSAQETLDSVQAAYDAGQADELELSTARLDVLNYQYEASVYENNLDLAYTAFSQLTGIQTRDFELEDRMDIPALDLPSADELISTGSTNSTQLQSLRKQVEIAKAETSRTRAENQLPSLTLRASYGLGSAASVSAFDDLWHDNASVSVGISIPVSSWIPGSSGDIAVKTSKDNEKLAAIALEAGVDDLYYSIEEDLLTLQQTSQALEIAEESLALSQTTYDLVQQRYEAGYVSIDDLSDARRDLLNARLTLNQSEVSQLIALYSLSFDTGVSTDELISTYSAQEQN